MRNSQAAKITLLAILLFHASTSAAALKYVTTHLEGDLRNKSVRTFLEDGNGNTWIGTQSGLYLYDDVSTTRSRDLNTLNASLSNLDVADLASTNQDGVLILGTSDSLFHYDPVRDSLSTIMKLRDGGHGQAKSLLVDSQGLVWIRYDDGIEILSLNHEGISVRGRKVADFEQSFSTELLQTDEAGVCGAVGKLLHCELEELLYSRSPRLVYESPYHIVAINEGLKPGEIILALADNTLCVLNLADPRPPSLHRIQKLTERRITSLEEQGGLLIVGTDGGVFSIDLAQNAAQIIPTVSSTDINNMYSKPDGVWILGHAGIWYAHNAEVYSWPADAGNTPIDVSSFSQRASTLYVGSNHGVHTLDIESNSPVEFSDQNATPKLVDDRVMSLQVIDPYLFVGYWDRGVQVLDLNNSKSQAQATLFLDGHGATSLLAFNEDMIVGTFDGGIKVFHSPRSSLSPPRHISDLDGYPVTSISAVNKSSLLVTTENKVYLLCEKDLYGICGEYPIGALGDSPRIMSSHIDSLDSTIWLGTLNSGIYRSQSSNNEQKARFSKTKLRELDRASIFSIEQRDTTTLLLGTNVGIWQLNTLNLELNRISTHQGHPSSNFNHGASITTQTGDTYFGSAHGFARLPSNSKEFISVPSRVWVKNVKIDKTEFSVASPRPSVETEIELLSRNRGFTVTLSVNDFRQPQSNRYKHTLENYDRTWIDSGSDNTASYSSLPPGNYTFRAKGADSLGVWSENEIVIPVRVLPSPWQTWYAYCLYLALFAVSLLLVKKINDRRVIASEMRKWAESEAAAHASTLDDYQEQVEENERLVRERQTASQQLLDIIHDVADISSQSSTTRTRENSAPLSQQLECLQLLHEMSRRTRGSQTVDMNAFTGEFISRLESRSTDYSQAIVLTDVEIGSVELNHAIYLSLVLQELLIASYKNTETNSEIDTVIEVKMAPPVVNDEGDVHYLLEVTDNGPIDGLSLAEANGLPLTEHLADSGILQFTVERELGTHVSVRFNSSTLNSAAS